MEKIIRSICLFSPSPNKNEAVIKHQEIADLLQANKFQIQTQRLCFRNTSIEAIEAEFDQQLPYLYALGSLNLIQMKAILPSFLESKLPISCNLQLQKKVDMDAVDILKKIIHTSADKTFHFCFSFGAANNSPFFPSTHYDKTGFSIGLQATNLAAICPDSQTWMKSMLEVWNELAGTFAEFPDFLGIDSSIAPLFDGAGSFIHFAQQQVGPLGKLCTSDFFTQISNFIKKENPKPIGLCGLMFPCLEDFELAKCYEKGAFNIERTIFLSLHSGVGIDTYPIGIDESPERILQILSLVQALSQKYQKALSVRFVSDGYHKIGEKSNFENPYLKDVILRQL